MSSAKTRLFLTIEKLKNAMDDPQMSYPYWEKFFPLLGNATTVSIDVQTLGELINEAAEVADQLIVTQGGVMYSQYLQNSDINVPAPVPAPAPRRLLTTTVPTPITSLISQTFDPKLYHSFVERIANYFVSASAIATPFTVKDLVRMYLYLSHVPKYTPLYELLEQALFKNERDCVPVLSAERTSMILDNLRDLTSITNYRLDFEAMVLMVTNIYRALNNELSKYPNVKLREYIGDANSYEKEVKPHKALADKFEMLVAQNSTHHVVAADNRLTFSANPMMVENVAANIEKQCDINRMVYNSINNIFINAVEQSAAENIKFDMVDYNKRFRILDRIRENSRKSHVEKLAVGNVGARKRTSTTTTGSPITTTNVAPPISLKKFKSSLSDVVVK